MTLEDPDMLSNRRGGDKGISPIDAPYVHYSPPRLLDARKWARGGDVERLREAALGGHAHRLLGLAAPGMKARTFLRDLPKLIAKCETLHLAATEGSLQEMKDVLENDSMRKRLAMCRDRAGVGLLHKAVYYDYRDIIKFLLENYPQTVHMRDSEGRTPLHYAAVCSDANAVAEEIIRAGAERNPLDSKQRQPSYYMTRPTALRLPEPPPPTPQQTELVIKPSNIRIWCHDRDLGRLQQVVWKGQGARLRTEVSNQPAVKKFLEAVPHIMGTIKDIHSSVIHNDLEKIQSLTEDPVPPIVLSSQDMNGLTPLHKAAGLGHYEIAEYFLSKYPEGTQILDNDGRTPLHWSILAKDDDKIYNALIVHGANESKLDNKLKSAAFYKNRPTDLDKGLLGVIPEAPRIASPTYPSSWDWELLKTDAQTMSNSITRTRKHVADKAALQASQLESPITADHNVLELMSPESDTAELPAEDSQEEHENGEPEYGDENGDNNTEEEIKINENDNNHNNDEEAENIGEASKSPTPEVPNDSTIIDDTSNKPNSAHSTSESSPNHAPNISRTLSASSERSVLHNGDSTRPNSAIRRKSSARSYRSVSAKSNASRTGGDEETGESNENDMDAENHETNNNSLENETIDENENTNNNEETDDHNGDNGDEESRVDDGDEESKQADGDQQTDEKNENEDGADEENDDVVEGTSDINDNIKIIDESTEHDVDEKTDLKEKSNQMEENDDESFSQSEEKSEESEFKGPQVQDIDDEKGDEPDTEGHESKRLDSRNSVDDSSKNRPASNMSQRKSSAHLHSADFLDVENLKRARSGARGHSQGSESTIEGIINADAEVDSLDADQRISESTPNEADMNIDDSEVQMLIESGNMEQLASLVLNGEGERLVGHMARNPELQAFLDNVPSYMNKIKRVHLSARDGNIRELQAALDRRKFAVARDQVSPGGATPLHVAVLFGHTPIVRYLAGRFPETLSAVDFEGRTALHYAAVLNDNDHYYNILLNMGANPKDQDDNGYTPEDYQKDDHHLSHKELLKTYGANESLVDEMLTDKETTYTTATTAEGGHNGQVDVPLFRTEEGKYLAMSLGDPLIKGLTEVANMRPKDPIAFLATYLYNFANQNKSRVVTQESAALIKSESHQLEAAPVPINAKVKEEEPISNHIPVAAPIAAGATSVPPTPGGPEVAFSSENRDEHGQSMLHFASARGHARGALLQLIREAGVSPAFRDELYRTARDVSIQANMPDNTKELDIWLLETAAKGEIEKMKELLINGYDHILDVEDEDGVPITEIVAQRELTDMSDLLAIIPEFEETRERLHQAIRQGDENTAREIMSIPQRSDHIQNLLSGKSLASAKNSFGRCSLHLAVLAQQEELVEHIAKTFPETLRIGDNLERTALHYAMGVDNVESTSRLLIKAGAKRVLKDLKGRQPSYYFMNKSDILRLKEEEEAY